MNDADLFNRFVLVSSVAAGAATAGIGLLLFAPRSWVGRAVAAAAAVAVTSGLTALLAADFLPLVAGGSAAVAVVSVLAGSSGVRQAVGRCARVVARPRVLGGAAVLAAFGLWGYEAWRFDAANAAMQDGTLLAVQVTPPATKPVSTAVTDRGGVIDLSAPVGPLTDRELASLEAADPMPRYASHVIARSKATDESNCHGWVFTGGRYNVGGRFVSTILSDNGYTRVTNPAAGDLCVYRSPDEEVSHTAIVRAVLPDGTVLVEGKWGRLGVYLHTAGESCYGSDFAYYHSARNGHLLSGVDSGAVEAASHP